MRAPTAGFVAVGGVRNDGAETGAAGPTLEGSFRLALSPAASPHPSGYPTDVTSVETTKPIGIRASAAEVEAALEALPSVRGVTVTLAAAGAGPGAAAVADGDACCTWLVTFDGHSAGLDAAVSVSAVALRSSAPAVLAAPAATDFVVEQDGAGASVNGTIPDFFGRASAVSAAAAPTGARYGLSPASGDASGSWPAAPACGAAAWIDGEPASACADGLPDVQVIVTEASGASVDGSFRVFHRGRNASVPAGASAQALERILASQLLLGNDGVRVTRTANRESPSVSGAYEWHVTFRAAAAAPRCMPRRAENRRASVSARNARTLSSTCSSARCWRPKSSRWSRRCAA